MSEAIITVAEFEERLATICLGGVGSAFPRRLRDRHIVYRSVLHSLEGTKSYSEAEINEAVQKWRLGVGTCLEIDYVTLRRYLIDEGYLSRHSNGSSYEVNPSGRGWIEFDPSIADVDPFDVVQSAKDRVSERKRRQALRVQT